MKVDTELPLTVRETEHAEIAMPDGTRLAARIWMPEDAEARPVPAILEYIPYRKNDKTLERDHARAPWLAAQGYAYVRVDLRGSGESEGVMQDEYTPVELQDGCDVIAWIADQAWCDGGVGIVGISWGGFNGLQIAALRPPALKAVVTICSTDDRYADDIHYMGGTLLCEQLSWASVMFGINTLPPDPAHVGDRWRVLADMSAARTEEHKLAFADAHFLAALLNAGDRDKAEAMRKSMERYSHKHETQARITKEVGLAVADAFLAIDAGKPGHAVDKLYPVREKIRLLGGSHAQRDFFDRLLVRAALSAGRHAEARHVLSERLENRPDSRWNWSRLANLEASESNAAAAAQAQARADALMAA